MSELRAKLVGAAILHGAAADAEDVAQEAICRFIEWSRTHEARNPVAWMYVTALRLTATMHRRKEVPLDDRHPAPDFEIDALIDARRILGPELAWLMRYTEIAADGWRRNQHTGRGPVISGRDRIRAMRLRRRLHAKEESSS